MGLSAKHLDAAGYRRFFWGARFARRGSGRSTAERPPARTWILTSDWCGGSRRPAANQKEENPDAV